MKRLFHCFSRQDHCCLLFAKTNTGYQHYIEAAITQKTKAVQPVSLYGQCADFDAINVIAEKHGLPVIGDAAKSFGATYKGRKSCELSTCAARKSVELSTCAARKSVKSVFIREP